MDGLCGPTRRDSEPSPSLAPRGGLLCWAASCLVQSAPRRARRDAEARRGVPGPGPARGSAGRRAAWSAAGDRLAGAPATLDAGRHRHRRRRHRAGRGTAARPLALPGPGAGGGRAALAPRLRAVPARTGPRRARLPRPRAGCGPDRPSERMIVEWARRVAAEQAGGAERRRLRPVGLALSGTGAVPVGSCESVSVVPDRRGAGARRAPGAARACGAGSSAERLGPRLRLVRLACALPAPAGRPRAAERSRRGWSSPAGARRRRPAGRAAARSSASPSTLLRELSREAAARRRADCPRRRSVPPRRPPAGPASAGALGATVSPRLAARQVPPPVPRPGR